jgi:hypothetical protein
MVHIFGIRHHGPGSARSLRQALAQLHPDIILVEGPPDAAEVLPLLVHPQMQPPVALLIYVRDAPERAVYYPFAVFSPEWQAIHYGLANDIPVRFMDLPQCHQLTAPSEEAGTTSDNTTDNEPSPEVEALAMHPSRDPLGFLAAAAGYSDGERWWEHMVEQRRDSAGIFAAILEAIAAVRAEIPDPADPAEAQREARREAWMRQTIRAAEQEGHQRIAVVCGAWHGPALLDRADAKGDSALLKELPKTKVQATWAPWTYGRLSYQSGYGAGVESPGWYHHLFASAEAGHSPTETAIHWLTRTARLMRTEGLDVSSAHVIEAVRLAETLTALRDRPLPGLPELNEATRAVFCFDSDLPMRLVHDKLIVGETLGAVPNETPMAPLQQDLTREQKRLKLSVEATWRDLDLDLRKTTDLERSHLLHRLNLLGIAWGQFLGARGGKGTFRETWRLQWQPELAIKLIEAGVWGNSIVAAASNRARTEAQQAADLPTLTALVRQALLASLPDAIPPIISHLETQAALTSDVTQMMATLPNLTQVLRYGDVRQTDASAVAHVVDGLVARICIGLPGACAALNDEAAAILFQRLNEANEAITLLQNAAHLAEWQAVLGHLADLDGPAGLRIHGLLGGRCVRLLLDQRVFDSAETARRMGLALSTASDPAYAAAWVDGLLRDSGALLVHDETLWQVVDSWVASLPAEMFVQLLPLLRRTFATFHAPERRSLGERARQGPTARRSFGSAAPATIDPQRAAAVLPLLGRLLGVRDAA